MDENYRVYRIWAPDDALWTQWAKPVLFSRPAQSYGRSELVLPDAGWASYPDKTTALFVDLPGKSGVLEGLALAELGYRPVPLYNGVYGANKSSMTVDVTEIAEALYQGAEQLASMALRPDAPPVFLLDENRMKGRARQPGKYDNRWCVFPQDLPSASYFLEHGIRQIYVRTGRIQNDLAHILMRYQEKGIKIFHITEAGTPKMISVVRPSHFGSFLYRFQTMLGLKRNAAGGFGGMVPEPTQSSGGRYYGIG